MKTLQPSLCSRWYDDEQSLQNHNHFIFALSFFTYSHKCFSCLKKKKVWEVSNSSDVACDLHTHYPEQKVNYKTQWLKMKENVNQPPHTHSFSKNTLVHTQALSQTETLFHIIIILHINSMCKFPISNKPSN